MPSLDFLNLNTLSRDTNNKKYIPEIDGIRFLAISTVFLYHLNTSLLRNFAIIEPLSWKHESTDFLNLGFYIKRLGVGVPIFFCLSGFILALPFLSKMQKNEFPNLRDYFSRRLSRLEPPYIISLALLFFSQLLILRSDVWDLSLRFLSGLIYGHRIIYGENNPINPVTWSLATEAQFYVVLPLLFFVVYKFRIHNLFLIAILIPLSIFAHSTMIGSGYENLSQSIITKFSYFGSGIIFANFYMNKNFKPFLSRKKFIWDVIFLISLMIILIFKNPTFYWLNNTVFCFSSLLLITSVFKGKMTNYFFTRKIIYTIGGMCYTIYLLHYALLHILTLISAKYISPELIEGLGYNIFYGISIFIYTPIILIISIVFFRYFEKPFMNKKWPNSVKVYLLKDKGKV